MYLKYTTYLPSEMALSIEELFYFPPLAHEWSIIVSERGEIGFAFGWCEGAGIIDVALTLCVMALEFSTSNIWK